MKMKKRILCALLLLVMLLQGCYLPFRTDGWPFPTSEAPAPSSETAEPSPEAGETLPSYVPYDEYERFEEAPLAPVPFSELTYERPDAQAVCDGYAGVQKLVEDGADADTVLSSFEPVYDAYTYFNTMGTYAYIRYTLDLNDPYFDGEYNWCEEQTPLIEQAAENCYIAMAESPLRTELEERMFGEGFFTYYDENRVFSNDRVVELMQQESQLQSQYMALQSDMTVEWDGEERLVEDLLADPSLSYVDMLAIYDAYYAKYNPAAAEIYIQLIRVRRALADELGYESYAHFAYEYYYERDYTPEQVADYTADIAENLSPLYGYALTGGYSAEMDSDTVMTLLGDAAYRFGGEIATAYEYMTAYGLYDITESSSKMPGSYMTYLPSYGMPFLYVSPTGTIDDLLTATHEFGHFTEGYVNCNYTSSIDCSEIFSQGLEFLMLNRADLSKRQRKGLESSKISDALLTFLSQACYAEFERRAYELPDEELTAENLNRIFMECNEEFGMSAPGLEYIIAPGWIDIQHFFIAPYYVISYCISNDVALQIYQIELESGAGLETYYDLMYAAPGNTVLALLDENGMQSPFEHGSMKELADFFAEYCSY